MSNDIEDTFNLYICVEDRQGGEFALGGIHTIEGWRQRAMQWCGQDCNEEIYNYLEKLQDNKVIATIDDYWEITIKPLYEVLPQCNLSVIQDILATINYISENIVALRTMQAYLGACDNEYKGMVEAILDKSMRIVANICGE